MISSRHDVLSRTSRTGGQSNRRWGSKAIRIGHSLEDSSLRTRKTALSAEILLGSPKTSRSISERNSRKIRLRCIFRRTLVMERRRRAEPSPPGFSTLIALHNHGPGSRATQRPGASGQPSNPSRRGLAGLEPEPLSIESVLGAVMSLRLPLRGRPERWPRYGKSFPGSMSRKGRSRRDLRSPWSSLLCITTDFL